MKKGAGGKIISRILLVLVALIFLVPVVMMALGSVKTADEAVRFDLSLPSRVTFENYQYVFEHGHVLTGYFNSVLMTVGATLIVLLCGALTGIYVGRTRSKVSSLLYSYFLLGLTLTFQIASTFAMLQKINLYGTRIAVIMIYAATQMPFTVMTFASFIKGIPKEIDEAGFIDGCGMLDVIFRVLIPMMKPIFITNLIVVAISCWNNFMIPLFYLESSSQWTIPLMVYNFFSQNVRNWNNVFAMLMVTIIPVVILYLCLQKYIVEGMTAGAVKG